MKFTLSWLKTYLDTDADLNTISETLTAIGLEVEEVNDPTEALKPFVIAKIEEAVQHPNADKLRVCTVNNGSETIQVVCGAHNAKTGLIGAFAPNGCTIPDSGMKLKPTNIRGVDSNGMMCSERELGLGDDHDGIIELPDDAPVGVSFAEYAKLNDPMIEIAITPNHQDALGVYGIARDLAAAGLGTLKKPDTSKVEGKFESPIKVNIESNDACPVFAGRYIRGVKNGPSPEWMQRRLISLGMKPISALVDITNFLTHDYGRPLHVFDADNIKGDLTIRLSKSGETLVALDEKEHTFDDEACIIADDNGISSIGGIMGGENSGTYDDTTNVFLECAWFDPIRTAMTGRKLNIESDARYRFERGVDPATVEDGIELATRLILDMCGGEPSEVYLAGEAPTISKTLTMRPERVAELGGVDIEKSDVISILERLDFKVEDNGATLEVTTPSWRCDIDREPDLVEEVLRIHGYDKIRVEPLPASSRDIVTGLNPMQRRIRMAKRTAAGLGLREAVTWSFIPSEHAKIFGDLASNMVLDNPVSSDLDAMRPNLLPNLITAAGRNVDRGFKNVALFEAGNQFLSDTPEGQQYVLAGIRRGENHDRHWKDAPSSVDVYDAKADAMAILKAIGVNADNAQVVAEAPDWYHPGRSGVIRLGPKNIMAYFGEIHPAVLKKLDVTGPLIGFEIMLGNIPLPRSKSGNSRGPLKSSDYQAVERDFAFVVDKDLPAEQIIKVVGSADKKLIDNINVFDVYWGKGIDDDKKSVAVNVRFQPMDRTMTDDEIESLRQKIIDLVAKKAGGTLR
ncbi:phenylalanine--tRNA ligase subunit beta [Pseudemcibacter aquimaris]|uniref:phenylalanine--tRNA ligase subunit beta n=1 Tax=Pseudemcibacter aquimaris TaxID=2857064 RepID=UPI002010DF41|nr:phenylalanine--tRNA ligase subunit beta [Pseudemcibacter aquimaris]MCC3861486.1 phenylalanine--tRNA ligase subunit beta [Pseudemcibacter aquimaris]WDU58255.1 phenylalanine--tRNA ligase subunit beta [Pseudemcibacter aquimaris]